MHYGAHQDQWLRFYAPEQVTALGAVMIIHGGYWREKYTAQLGEALAMDLAARGIPTYNLEYRRGPGSAAQMLADARLALALITRLEQRGTRRLFSVGLTSLLFLVQFLLPRRVLS